MIKEEIIDIEEIFTGFIYYDSMLDFNLALVQREGERQMLEELQEKLVYYANAIPDLISYKYKYIPETIVVDNPDEISTKLFLDSLSEFLSAVGSWCVQKNDNEILTMVEDLLSYVNQANLSTSLSFLN